MTLSLGSHFYNKKKHLSHIDKKCKMIKEMYYNSHVTFRSYICHNYFYFYFYLTYLFIQLETVNRLPLCLEDYLAYLLSVRFITLAFYSSYISPDVGHVKIFSFLLSSYASLLLRNLVRLNFFF